VETIKSASPDSGPVAESASVETQFGAPVVRELPPDPGPHEFLITVPRRCRPPRPSSASVYKLCQRGELHGSASAVLSGSIQLPSTSTWSRTGIAVPARDSTSSPARSGARSRGEA